MYISLKDNRYYNTVPWNEAWKDYGESGNIAPAPTDDGYKDTLKKFSGVPLTELTKPENEKKYGKFLVFPSYGIFLSSREGTRWQNVKYPDPDYIPF